MKTTDDHHAELSVSPPAVAGVAPLATRPAAALASASAPIGPGNATSLDVLSLVRALRRRWKLAFVLGLLGTATAGGLTYLLMPPPQYTAVATLQVKQEQPRILFNIQEARTAFETYINSQKELIKSDKVLGGVLESPSDPQKADSLKIVELPTVKEVINRGDDPLEWLQKQVNINSPPNSEILHVSLSGNHPEDLAKLVNVIVRLYKERVVDKSKVERSERLEQLRVLWEDYQKTLEQKRQQLRSMAKVAGSDDKKTLVLKQQLDQQQAARIEQEILDLDSDLMRLEAELAARQDQKDAPSSPPELSPKVVEQHVEKSPEVQRARAEIANLQKRHDSYSRIAKKGNDPALVRASKELKEASKALDRLREETRDQVVQQLRSGPADQPSEVQKTRHQIEVFKKFREKLAKRLDDTKINTQKQAEQTLDLQKEQDEIAVLAETAAKVKQEYEATDVELKGAPARIEEVDAAKIPRMKDNKKQIQATAMASLGTLASILFGISFWEVRARRISSVDQVINGLGLRVVGSLPALPTASPNGRALGRTASRDWQSLLVESVDAIRAMLLYASRVEQLRTVIVTSAQTGEGKTSLASHLAASLARAGRRTLLIDCDLRRPAIHRLFDLPLGPGLSELLRGEAEREKVLQPSPANHLAILTTGQVDERTMEAIGRGDLQAVFNDLKAQFDFLIVDSAPILPVADTLLISQHADVAIFSIMHEVSRVPLVQAAYERLASLGVPILGAVVAGTNDQTYYRSSYHYQSDKAVPAS